MTNMQAALGLAQLERLGVFVRRKRRMGARYNDLLAGLQGAQLPLANTAYAENIYWVYSLVLDEQVGMDADGAMRRLTEKGVATRPFFCPMHMQPVLRRMGLFEGEQYPVAERLYQPGFYIPSGMALTDEQLEASAQSVREILQ